MISIQLLRKTEKLLINGEPNNLKLATLNIKHFERIVGLELIRRK